MINVSVEGALNFFQSFTISTVYLLTPTSELCIINYKNSVKMCILIIEKIMPS